jgi:hypothetical protein
MHHLPLHGANAADFSVRASSSNVFAFPFWPNLAKEWLEHRILNDRLARLGFFDSHSFDHPAPAKQSAKRLHKKSRKTLLKAKR